MGWGWYRDFYPPSTPRRVRGGIKAQSQRGNFGTSWWAKRWISILEGFQIGARLSRGRSYARNGQVVSIDIDQFKVHAKVQGSSPKPYDVTIEVKEISTRQWNRLVEELTRQAVYAARLLSGEMPQDIEEIFKAADLSLFPEHLNDLTTDCSCPDWSNPCKHVAAVYYLIGEEFDRDPFLIFKLRGLPRDELIKRLGKTGNKTVPADASVPSAAEGLPTDPGAFWSMGAVPDTLFGAKLQMGTAAAIAKRLGSFPFWRGEQNFLNELEMIYARAAGQGLARMLGE